jgi:hypothetical protein
MYLQKIIRIHWSEVWNGSADPDSPDLYQNFMDPQLWFLGQNLFLPGAGYYCQELTALICLTTPVFSEGAERGRGRARPPASSQFSCRTGLQVLEGDANKFCKLKII